MRDVAAFAKVGLMTVSRVVNGVDTVADDLKERVLDAIEKLDYRHNQNASRMRSLNAAGGTIALCVENVDNPFSSGIQRGLEDVARASEFLVFSASSDGDPDTERRLIEAFCERQVDGLVILPVGHNHSFLARRIQRGLGVVYVDRPAPILPADVVMTEHEQGGFLAAKHLIEMGHTRISFIGNVDDYPVSERYAGFLHALNECGITPMTRTVQRPSRSLEDARREVHRIMALADPPTAIFSAVDLLTMGARIALHELSLESSIAQVGFDDFQLADALTPGLTVYRQDTVTIGRRCGSLLLERLDCEEQPAGRSVVIPGTLIARGSGEIRPPR